MVTYNSYASKSGASHRPPFTFGAPTADYRISRNVAFSSSSQYDNESDDSDSTTYNPFQSRWAPSWNVLAPATGHGGVRSQQQPQQQHQQRPISQPPIGPVVHAPWSSSPPHLLEPHAAAAAKDQATRDQMWAAALDDRRLAPQRPLVLAAKDKPQTIRDQMWATATLDHNPGRPGPPVIAAAINEAQTTTRDQMWAAALEGNRLGCPGPPVVPVHTAPWSQIPQTQPPAPPPPFPHLLKANYRAPYAQDEEYTYKQLFFDESALSSHGLMRRRAVKAAIDEWLATSSEYPSALGSPAYSSSMSLEGSADLMAQGFPAKATSLVSCAKPADLVSIVFVLLGFVLFFLTRLVLNKAANTLGVFVSWRVPGPPENMMPRDEAGWSTVQSAPWK